MARPDLRRVKTPAPQTLSPHVEAPRYTSTAQTLYTPVMSNRPSPAQSAELTVIDTVLRELPAPVATYRALASEFFHRAVGIAYEQGADAALLYLYLTEPMDYAPVRMDDAWQEQLFGDGMLDGWLATIREQYTSALAAGPTAYAQAVMQQVLAGAMDGDGTFPAVLCEIAGWLDSIALCAALDSDLDLRSLERLSSRLCARFLCNTVLLPRLRVDPAAFPAPRPSADDVDSELADAFETYAERFQNRLMKISEQGLGAGQREKLHRLLRTSDWQGWMEENAATINGLGLRRHEFLGVAGICLTAPLSDCPLAFPLTCLLRIYQSYPQNLEQQVDKLALRVINSGARQGHVRDREALVQQRNELQVQRRLWLADVAFVRRELVKFTRLDEAGKEYLSRQLSQLALAEYRPRFGALNLRTVLRHASRQQESIVELEEPDQ